MYLLPSLFTAGNIALGYLAISQAVQGTVTDYVHFDIAAKAIGFAILFDGLDGRIARMTSTTSDFGRELDSLADCVTFGVAPAILAWQWGFRFLPAGNADLHQKIVALGAVATFLFLMAGASRLARFNIQKNPQPSNPGRPGRKYFVGMPIPAAAGVVAAVVHFFDAKPVGLYTLSALWGALIIASAFLMVSTWRFYSFKDIDLRRKHPFTGIILIAGLFALIWFFSEYVLFILALTYMLSGVLARIAHVFRRKPMPPAPPLEPASQTQ
jgi:CDP-diacylglycerol--serine O-phosphatidyltransferase